MQPVPTIHRQREPVGSFLQAGDASGTGLLDIQTHSFDHNLISSLDPAWPVLFPPLLKPAALLGTVKPNVAELLGVRRGMAVAAGSGDNMMSALGAGAVASGDLVISLGTSGTVFGTADHPVHDPSGAIAPFCDATGAPHS
jgi:xylulokinase